LVGRREGVITDIFELFLAFKLFLSVLHSSVVLVMVDPA